jgi:hypothetical protein
MRQSNHLVFRWGSWLSFSHLRMGQLMYFYAPLKAHPAFRESKVMALQSHQVWPPFRYSVASLVPNFSCLGVDWVDLASLPRFALGLAALHPQLPVAANGEACEERGRAEGVHLAPGHAGRYMRKATIYDGSVGKCWENRQLPIEQWLHPSGLMISSVMIWINHNSLIFHPQYQNPLGEFRSQLTSKGRHSAV